ncbi:hypothetical protein DFS34DRAFT_696682 [Phlyctochytrium arcticum]|nr:hypothetical protein DFS34DRAFT_696682 [Phlyctochytrium arcticum]
MHCKGYLIGHAHMHCDNVRPVPTCFIGNAESTGNLAWHGSRKAAARKQANSCPSRGPLCSPSQYNAGTLSRPNHSRILLGCGSGENEEPNESLEYPVMFDWTPMGEEYYPVPTCFIGNAESTSNLAWPGSRKAAARKQANSCPSRRPLCSPSQYNAGTLSRPNHSRILLGCGRQANTAPILLGVVGLDKKPVDASEIERVLVEGTLVAVQVTFVSWLLTRPSYSKTPGTREPTEEYVAHTMQLEAIRVVRAAPKDVVGLKLSEDVDWLNNL